jgi:glycosyltransferase involved in cell wall biosynthesis
VDLLAVAQVFLLTSLWEGLPRALVEAVLAGVAPVCYDTDGVRDVLGAGDPGLIPQGHVAAAAAAVKQFALDSPERRARVAALQARIGADFDIDNMVRQQESLYMSLFQKKAAAAPGPVR